MEEYFDNSKDNRLFIGTDLNGASYYIEIPDVFLPYKKSISDSINSVFHNSFSNIVHPSFIQNMKSRDVLHLFIQKHTLTVFKRITTIEQLELLIKKEFIKQFEIKEDDAEVERLLKRCKKSIFVEAYITSFYKTKLLEYKERLDQVEL